MSLLKALPITLRRMSCLRLLTRNFPPRSAAGGAVEPMPQGWGCGPRSSKFSAILQTCAGSRSSPASCPLFGSHLVPRFLAHVASSSAVASDFHALDTLRAHQPWYRKGTMWPQRGAITVPTEARPWLRWRGLFPGDLTTSCRSDRSGDQPPEPRSGRLPKHLWRVWRQWHAGNLAWIAPGRPVASQAETRMERRAQAGRTLWLWLVAVEAGEPTLFPPQPIAVYWVLVVLVPVIPAGMLKLPGHVEAARVMARSEDKRKRQVATGEPGRSQGHMLTLQEQFEEGA